MDVRQTYVFNIQRYSLHDGPGIRTIVFLKGCPMRCRWCCNPESQLDTPEISYVENQCIGVSACGFCQQVCPVNAISFEDKAKIDRMKCINCLKCAEVCPSKAIKTEGTKYTVNELLDLVERDSVFYGHGDGGLTVSGGEPLMQGDFLIALLKGAKKRRIHTAIETCGSGEYAVLSEAAKYLDAILFDIKSLDDAKHREYTGHGNEKIIENFSNLCREYPLLEKRVRTPIIPGFNDTEAEIRRIKSFLADKPNVTHELLKYHTFGMGKYKALGREYPMEEVKLSDSKFEELKAVK